MNYLIKRLNYIEIKKLNLNIKIIIKFKKLVKQNKSSKYFYDMKVIIKLLKIKF